MDWSISGSLAFIKAVEEVPLLWDRREPNFRSNNAIRQEAWNELGAKFGLSGELAYNKWKSLKASHHRELDSPSSSLWFGMEAMSFMIPLYRKRRPETSRTSIIGPKTEGNGPFLEKEKQTDEESVILNGGEYAPVFEVPDQEESNSHHGNDNSSSHCSIRPDCEAFGKYIASELATLNYVKCQKLKLRITQMLCKATQINHRKRNLSREDSSHFTPSSSGSIFIKSEKEIGFCD